MSAARRRYPLWTLGAAECCDVAMPSLSCASSQPLGKHFQPTDSRWEASTVIRAIESVRAGLRVPFFIYDRAEIGVDLDRELGKLDRCNVSQVPGLFYGGEYWFLKAAARHPWRVYDPSSAAIIVVPGFPTFEGHGEAVAFRGCPGLTAFSVIADRVSRTPLWEQRSRDHIFISMGWRHFAAAIQPANVSNRSGADARSLTRFFIEHSAFSLSIRETKRPAEQASKDDYVLPAPYVENGPADDFDDGGERATPIHDFFFGGQTTSRLGPGRRHVGYYMRWSLMQQWANRPKAFGRTLLVETDNAGKTIQHVETMRGNDGSIVWPAVRRCDHASLDTVLDQARLANARKNGMHSSWTQSHRNGSAACVPPCASVGLGTAGACYGSYDIAQVLPTTRFVLCVRGDIATSPRLYDALHYGSIPVLVSDHMRAVGLPFQCFVPYELMVPSISEADMRRDAAEALRNLSDTISPAIESRMRQLLRHFRKDVLWRVPGSRVAENILLEAERFRLSRTRPAGCCPLADLTLGLSQPTTHRTNSP